MNTFKQKLPFPLSFKIYKNTAFIALKKIIINQGIKSNFCYHFFSVIAIRLIILAARFQKQSNMFFLIFQILKFHFKKNILPWLWHISLTITICIPSPSCNRLLLFTKLIYDMSRVFAFLLCHKKRLNCRKIHHQISLFFNNSCFTV